MKGQTIFVRVLSAFGRTPVLILLAYLSLWKIESVFLIWVILLIQELVISIIKVILFKERPKKKTFSNLIEKISAASFPSAHVARSTFVTTSIYFLLQTPFAIIYLFVPILVGYSRVYRKKHFLTDVIAGYLLGLVWFFLFSSKLI